MRRLLDKLKLDRHLRGVGISKRRKEDYSPCEVCYGMHYGLMLGIFRPIHIMELDKEK